MSTILRRVTDIEERKAFRNYTESQRKFEGRSPDELGFFAVYGYFPESLEWTASAAAGVHSSRHSATPSLRERVG